MPRNYSEGIDHNTGEYFFHEHKKKAPRPPKLWLDMEKSLWEQLDGKVSDANLQHLESLRQAFKTLCNGGILPESRGRAAHRQINLAATRAISKFKKANQ